MLQVKKAPALAIQEEDELKENLEPPRGSAPSRFVSGMYPMRVILLTVGRAQAKQPDTAGDEPEAAASKPAAKVPARLLVSWVTGCETCVLIEP